MKNQSIKSISIFKIMLLASIFTISSCSKNTPANSSINNNDSLKKNSFSIKGVAKNFPDQEISLTVDQDDGGDEVLLTTHMANGQFEFNGQLPASPMGVTFRFGDQRFFTIDTAFLESEKMTIELALSEGKLNELKKDEQYQVEISSLTGSSAHDVYERVENLSHEQDSKISEIYEKSRRNKELTKKDEMLVENLNEEKCVTLKKVVKKSLNKIDSLFALRELLFKCDHDDQAKLFALVSPELQNSHIGVTYKKMLDERTHQAKMEAEVAIGMPLKDFTLNDTNDKPVKLSNLLQPKRYIFLDFWASWCKPCRAENPNVLKAYKKYHTKGFDVVAISLDSEKDAWIEAIEEDGMPWLHLSDLEVFESEVVRAYGVAGVPATFLLDDSGTIIAKDLHGEALHEKLAELLDS